MGEIGKTGRALGTGHGPEPGVGGRGSGGGMGQGSDYLLLCDKHETQHSYSHTALWDGYQHPHLLGAA